MYKNRKVSYTDIDKDLNAGVSNFILFLFYFQNMWQTLFKTKRVTIILLNAKLIPLGTSSSIEKIREKIIAKLATSILYCWHQVIIIELQTGIAQSNHRSWYTRSYISIFDA